MEYHGKLYGKIGNKYFDTSYTSKNVDDLTNENVELKLKLVNLLKGLEMQNMNRFLDVAKPKDYLHFGQVYKSAVTKKINENK
jgi:hypothetical protein